jgi:hypothetical protein
MLTLQNQEKKPCPDHLAPETFHVTTATHLALLEGVRAAEQTFVVKIIFFNFKCACPFRVVGIAYDCFIDH